MQQTPFPENASISLLQKYVRQKCQERGFDKAEDLEIWLLLTEEVGELSRAIRKKRQLFTEVRNRENADQMSHDAVQNSQAISVQGNLAEEMADVLSYLLDLANRFNVDLEQAFRLKESENDKREWL